MQISRRRECKWAGPHPPAARIAAKRDALDADIVVLIVAVIELLARPGHLIDAGGDWVTDTRSVGARERACRSAPQAGGW
jgi:hypothetical protein